MKQNTKTMTACDLEDVHANHLLASLRASGCPDLSSYIELVQLPMGKVIYESGGTMRYVYFPTTAIVSMLYIMNDGTSDEIATVGNEGFIGIQLFLGCETIPSRALVRSAGHAFRLDASLLQKEFGQSPAVQHLLLRYMQSLLAQISQTAACNRHHSIHQRLCRWILSSLDRLPTSELKTTHETIGEMLNVRRESITQELGELKGAGLIHCQRGRITVVNRAKLEGRACECYGAIRREFSRLLAATRGVPVRNDLEEIWQSRATGAATQVRFGVPNYTLMPHTYGYQEEELSLRRSPAIPA
jgi:CRP-like cAMP-binding protein